MDLDVPTPTYLHVVTRADRTCQCQGACGRPHSDGGGRCYRGWHRAVPVRLVVAPADPAVPAHAAWRTPVKDLQAWCGPCLDQARRLAARRPQPADIPLFEIAEEA